MSVLTKSLDPPSAGFRLQGSKELLGIGLKNLGFGGFEFFRDLGAHHSRDKNTLGLGEVRTEDMVKPAEHGKKSQKLRFRHWTVAFTLIELIQTLRNRIVDCNLMS